MRSVVVLIVFMLQFLAAAERHKPTSWLRHCFSCCTSAPVEDEPREDVQAACVSTSIVVQPPAAIPAPASAPPSQERLKAALSELEHVINAKNGSVDVSDYTSSVASIIRSDFSRITSAEVRGRIHDLMHSLAGIEYAFQVLKAEPTSVASMRSLEEGMAFLRKMIQATYGSGQQEDRPQDLSEVIASSVAACAPTARQAGVELICDLPDELRICLDMHPLDTGRVTQNLVDNAVRYTQGFPNPRVIVKAFKHAEKHPEKRWWMTRITVQDNGAGMSKEMLEYFGQPGYRDKATSHLPGSGIGLASSIQLVKDRGGGLEAASEGPGKGSTVFFTLPCTCVDCTTAPSVPGVRRRMNKSNMSVLIVDDIIPNQKVFEFICKKAGISGVATVPTGEKAITWFTSHPQCPLILMDDSLGSGINGKEATKRIRSLPNGRDTVIFSTSGTADDQSKAEFFASGINACLPKPANPIEFARLLEMFFDFA